MKAWIGSQDLMRDRSRWVLWDREWRQAWRPAVALTAATTVCGDKRPGGTEGCFDKRRKESSVSGTVLGVPQVFPLRIFYIRFRITPKSIRFQSCFITPGLEGFPPPPSIIKWTLQMMGEELSPHIFLITVPKHSWFDVH